MFKIPKNVDYQFISRALSDELSPEEKEFFEQWLAESEKNKELFSEITLLLDKIDSSNPPKPPNPILQWDAIRQKVKTEEIKNETKNLISERTPILFKRDYNKWENNTFRTDYWHSVYTSRMLQIVMILLIMVSVGLNFLMERFPIRNAKEIVLVDPPPKLIDVKTRKGEKLVITLSDGSKVHLNNLSKLSYPETFGEKSRDVTLEGEAYFSVTSNKEKPFSVKSGNVLTVVTGTEFDIKNRGERISVVVVKGSVNTYSPNKEEAYKLKSGDLLSYDERANVSKLQKANLHHYLAWRNDKFSFEHARLADVMDEIERYYNLKASFQSDSLKNITMTGFFGSDSLNKILSVISLTLDIKLKYDGSTIFINKH
jgi:ferric-dicitrate binding protein FerR (iron transport regulator)